MPLPTLLSSCYYNAKRYSAVCLLIWASVLLPYTVQADVLKHRSQQDVLQFLMQYQPEASNGKKRLNFTDFIQQLSSKRVILVGEIHDRYDHHLNQLALLKALHERDPNMGIGVEWFQQPFQPVLDAYLAGRIDEAEMLRRSGYYDRWRYDYRMLRPILIFAKDNKIPVLALNAPVEVTQKVAQGGLGALSETERKQLPAQIAPPESSYLHRLRQIFMAHGHGSSDERFENFTLVQRIWDETMAANAVEFLQANPRYRLMIFAGAGHMSDHMGIPNDMARAIPAQSIATVTTSNVGDIQAGLFDYFIVNPPLALPPNGRLGAWFEPDVRGLKVSKLSTGGGAAQAGVLTGDRLVRFNEIPVTNLGGILALLANYVAGDKVKITLERDRMTPKGTPSVKPLVLTVDVKLQ